MDNITEFPNKAAIKEEAGAWIVRLDGGNCSKADLLELQLWMQRSDFHREYLLSLAANWDGMAVLQELGEMFPLPPKEEPSTPRPGLKKWLSLIGEYFHFPSAVIAAGTMAAMLIMVAIFANTSWIMGRGNELMTEIGERQTRTLDDGTVIHLNTNTLLEVHYSDTRRAVTLVHGEASFDVAKNPEKPFVVYAGTGLVWAVGTAFNVRYEDAGQVDVIVTEGQVKVFSDTRSIEENTLGTQKVAVSPETPRAMNTTEQATPTRADAPVHTAQEQREALLGAGKSLRYRQVIESVKAVQQEETRRLLAWREGSLVFKGETLEQVIAEISRYTDKQLIIADEDLKGLRVGGHYKTDDIDALLASLGQGLDISVHYAESNRVFLSGSGG